MSRPLLLKLRDEGARLLRERVAIMHDKADDAFFAQAEKVGAQNGTAFMAAMKVVRDHRAAIEDDFVRAFSDGVTAALKHVAGEDQNLLPEELSLVDTAKVDERVVIDSLSNKARREFAVGIDALQVRCNHLLRPEGVQWEEENNPFDPLALVEHFEKAARHIDLDPAPRVFYFKMFDRHVISALGDFYAALNEILIEASVLPAYAKAAQKSASSSRSKSQDSARETSSDEGAAGGEDTGSMLRELLAVMRGNAQSMANLANAAPMTQVPMGMLPVIQNGQALVNGVPVADNVQVTVLQTQDLMALLNQIQHLSQNRLPLPDVQGEDGLIIDVQAERVDIATEIRQRSGDDEEHVHAVEAASDDVINLVSMLFNFILDDEGLPESIKALVGRLQIPFIKVALIDPTLFDNDEHPAKLLLNLIADLGNDFDAEDATGKALYFKIRDVVGRILDEFESDVGLFNELLQDLQSFADQLRRRQAALQKRLRDMEEGRAKQRDAEQAVNAFLAERVGDKKIPAVAFELLNDFWRKVMIYTFLNQGGTGEEWDARAKVADVLLWSLRTPKDDAMAQKQKQFQPKLLLSLHNAAQEVGYDKFALGERIRDLKAEFDAIAAGHQAKKISVVMEKVAAAEGGEGQSVEQRADGVVVMRTAAPEAPSRQAVEITSETWDVLDGLSVEARGEMLIRGEMKRVKLAAYIRSINKYIFISASGVKVAECSREELAHKVQLGEFKVVQEGSLFNRALASVIADVRNAERTVAAG